MPRCHPAETVKKLVSQSHSEGKIIIMQCLQGRNVLQASHLESRIQSPAVRLRVRGGTPCIIARAIMCVPLAYIPHEPILFPIQKHRLLFHSNHVQQERYKPPWMVLSVTDKSHARDSAPDEHACALGPHREIFRAQRTGDQPKSPMVLVKNEHTQSSSEIWVSRSSRWTEVGGTPGRRTP